MELNNDGDHLGPVVGQRRPIWTKKMVTSVKIPILNFILPRDQKMAPNHDGVYGDLVS